MKNHPLQLVIANLNRFHCRFFTSILRHFVVTENFNYFKFNQPQRRQETSAERRSQARDMKIMQWILISCLKRRKPSDWSLIKRDKLFDDCSWEKTNKSEWEHLKSSKKELSWIAATLNQKAEKSIKISTKKMCRRWKNFPSV